MPRRASCGGRKASLSRSSLTRGRRRSSGKTHRAHGQAVRGGHQGQVWPGIRLRSCSSASRMPSTCLGKICQGVEAKVSQERATELKRIYNAAVSFNIPLLKKLLDVSTSKVQTQSMGSTGYNFLSSNGKERRTRNQSRPGRFTRRSRAPLGQCERREYNQEEETLKALEILQRPKLPCALVQPAKQHHLDIGRARCNGRRRGRDDDAAAVRRYLLRPRPWDLHRGRPGPR